jgi:predicted RND superfamily exporter protein
MAAISSQSEMPIVRDPKDFDTRSGMRLERFIFNFRPVVLLLCALITVVLAWQATKLPINASFEKMMPASHPFVQNANQHKEALRGMGNALRIAVVNTESDIFDPNYLRVLQQVNDKVYALPGVDRGWMRSLWTTSLRWTEVTEEGYRGGPMMPDRFDGSPAALEQLRANVARAGIVGEYVSDDFRSSMIFAPLVGINPETGAALDYTELSQAIEREVRTLETPTIKIKVVGFAKLVGDLIDGLHDVMRFFALSVLIAAACVAAYTRCWRSTLLLVAAAALGVVWLLGLMQLMGYVLDPYSVLVPFLVFAIGLSHGAQKMNGVMQDIGRGTHKYVAARYTFRRLFLAGLTALLTNVVGFAVLMIIDIPVIRDMAITTSLGIGVLVFTKLVLIPVMLSYTGVSPAAARRSIQEGENGRPYAGPLGRIFNSLGVLTERRWAIASVATAVGLTVFALFMRAGIQIGDLSPGAPELRPESRYNQDVAFVTRHFGMSTDQFVVMVQTQAERCKQLDALLTADVLGSELRQLDGVRTVYSSADGTRRAVSGAFEGNPKWMTLPRNTSNLAQAYDSFSADRPDLADRLCTVLPVVAYLDDHKAQTLNRIVDAVDHFAAQHSTAERPILMAAGSAGIEAATNIVVKSSFWTMHFVLYGAVILLCLLTFRSWRATVVALVPLMITSLLCEALMVMLNIGLKVATLPVIAVGVGVGVDYALYLLSVQLAAQRRGLTLREAYLASLNFTGRIVALVGVTMAAGVITWAWSPIKFQADMGILLTFMFIWNMLGALLLIPALSYFLLRTDADRLQQNQPAPQGSHHHPSLPGSGIQNHRSAA